MIEAPIYDYIPPAGISTIINGTTPLRLSRGQLYQLASVMMSLADLHARLSRVYNSIQSFEIPVPQPPVIDLSLVHRRHNKHVLPGLRFLREEVKRDCEVLDKFLRENANSSALSTNAPYLIAVCDELVHAHQPVAVYRMFSLMDGQADARKTPKGKKSPRIQARTVKVDIVAENGAKWVRVNTTKNSRLMMEFREIDSYLTSDEDEDEPRPRIAPAEFDNSVLRMGRDLLAAAKANPVSIHPPSGLLSDSESATRNPDDTMVPQITIRLIRLDDNASDPRVEKTIQFLREMGIDVQLGERPDPHPPPIWDIPTKQELLQPTTHINLDLSALIALISDTSHSPLPQTEEEAHARFVPPQHYLDWKKVRAKLLARRSQTTGPFRYGAGESEDDEDTWEISGQHSRALAAQVVQEMNKGTLEEIHDRLSSVVRDPSTISSCVTFWTTSEARYRCLQIVSTIGGKNERQRADALLGSMLCSGMSPVPAPADTSSISVPRTSKISETMSGMHDTEKNTAADMYWEHSRYSARFLPPTPVHIYSSILPTPNEDSRLGTSFFDALAWTCSGILSQTVSQVSVPLDPSEEVLEEIPPATQTSLPKLTEHTIRSMLAGASRRYTTLTTNRSSIKAILKEMRRVRGNGGYDAWMMDVEKAALWVLDPRSLSEGMRSE